MPIAIMLLFVYVFGGAIQTPGEGGGVGDDGRAHAASSVGPVVRAVSARKISSSRSPDTIITTAVMPIAIMLLFVYVFGGAIQTGTASYVGMDWNRSTIPPCRSRNSRCEVYATPEAIVMSRMPGSITTAVMPIAIMLLFVYVFGGAIQTGTASYVDYLLPGILLITIASGVSRARRGSPRAR
jgi:hypothetical protein